MSPFGSVLPGARLVVNVNAWADAPDNANPTVRSPKLDKKYFRFIVPKGRVVLPDFAVTPLRVKSLRIVDSINRKTQGLTTETQRAQRNCSVFSVPLW
jgi:hypothetical protein